MFFMDMEKKSPLSDLMSSTMEKIHEMVDTNTIVGEPITTPDGVTLIPISRVTFGFGSGGGDYGKPQPQSFGGGSGGFGGSSPTQNEGTGGDGFYPVDDDDELPF